MSAMVWGVKASLVQYTQAMPDGRVETADGVEATAAGFRFPPADEPLAFRGSVTFTGHGGMMRVVLADPRLVETADGWDLTVRDDGVPGGRLRFATLEALAPDADGGRRATRTRLTADGADLFFGPYVEGTQLDDPRVEP
ncbi:HtaA domain-containing protein [Isoptericola sp. NPDC057391]|uniref:HtaA domain-containing protein n=1 Tax=Isoptericola sp. NPDC057391 TaxID=3346117 RepID=UPI003634AE30